MRHMICLIILALLAIPVLGQSGPTPEASKAPANLDDKAIRQIEDDYLNAEKTTNVAVLERVLADDFVNLIPRGVGPGKADLVASLQPKAGQVPPYTVETGNMHIYILGDTAVVAFTKIYTAKENGNVAREDDTHIFTKDHGVWRLRISRATIRGSELE